MRDYYLYPGMKLWYCNRNTGDLGTVGVTRAYSGSFYIRYRGKEYEMPMNALGTRLFFTRKGASCPSEIIKNRDRREKQAQLEENSRVGPYCPYEELEPFDNDEQDYQKNYYSYSNRDSGETEEEQFSLGSWLEKQNHLGGKE